jgi:hypothetical protein
MTTSNCDDQSERLTAFTEAERKAEEKNIRYLRRLVDLSSTLIAQSRITLEETQQLVQVVRAEAHRIFPDKKQTFELIYTPRFRRLIAEKYGLQ